MRAGWSIAGVRIRGLTKRFKDAAAVSDLTLEVKDREFVVLLGPSGCGKTTTLRCIAGLETADEGEIYIGDRLVNELDPRQRNVAMVFQSYALYPHMTAYQNIAFPLENARVAEREVVERVNKTARLLQIGNLLGRKPSELSGGQRQRVALGRAIVREPTVFLMDEPLSNLDAKLRVHMRVELKRLQKDLGITTVYVTHDQLEAMTMADRIALMDRGKLKQFDDPRTMYTRPVDRFVAEFIGNPPINLFECDLTEDGVLDAGDFRIAVPEPLRAAVAAGSSRALTLGIRPQDVQVHRDEVRDSAQIPASVYTTEPTGDAVILDLKVGASLVRVVVGPDFVGSGLWLQFPPDKMHVFDRASGKAIV